MNIVFEGDEAVVEEKNKNSSANHEDLDGQNPSSITVGKYATALISKRQFSQQVCITMLLFLFHSSTESIGSNGINDIEQVFVKQEAVSLSSSENEVSKYSPIFEVKSRPLPIRIFMVSMD